MNHQILEKTAGNDGAQNGKSLGRIMVLSGLITLLSVSCCGGVPLIISLLGTVGMGFLIKKHLLFPLMVASLLIGSWAAFISYRTRQNRWFLLGYLSCAVAIPVGMKTFHPLMYGGMVCLLALTVWELFIGRVQSKLCRKSF